MIGVAVVGCGYWGPNLLRNLRTSSRFTVKLACDLDPEALLRAAAWAEGVTPTFADVLDAGAVDAVVIATPPETHADLAVAALRAGKHVWVEKPMATSVADAYRMVEEAEKAHRVLFVDHTFVYAPAVEVLAGLVKNGDLGRIRGFDSVRVNLGIVQRTQNVVWDLAPHDLSIFEAVVGRRIEAVRAVLYRRLGPDHPATLAHVDFAAADDVVGHLTLDWVAPVKTRRTTFTGDRQMAVYDDTDPARRVWVYDAGAGVTEENRVEYRSGAVVLPRVPQTEPLSKAVAHFADCLENGYTPRTDGAMGLRIVGVLEAIDRAAALGGWVSVR